MRQKFSHRDGPQPDLDPIQLIRAHYGLTQEELATFIGVPRATLALNEKPSARSGPRGIPAAAWLRLTPFLTYLPAAEADAPPLPDPNPLAAIPPKDDDILHRALRRRWIKCQLKTMKLQHEQQREQVRLAQAQLRLRALPALRAAVPKGSFEPVQRTWLDYFELVARNILSDDEAAKDRELRALRLRVLAYEIAQLAGLLNAEAAGQEG